jgi:hypothetical protein
LLAYPALADWDGSGLVSAMIALPCIIIGDIAAIVYFMLLRPKASYKGNNMITLAVIIIICFGFSLDNAY